jgi:hypothetical protein
MTTMASPIRLRTIARTPRAALAAVAVCAAALLAGGCATGHPAPISARELAGAQTFPYYRTYWVGRSFNGHPLSTADGLQGYIPSVGDSVYYGDCVRSKGIFGGGSCQLPLQVTTVIYRLHANTSLGEQSNLVVRGVPATAYDEGRSIEIYSGRVAIDVFSNTLAHALQAADKLLPLNAPGSASQPLPAPVYCPGLSGPISHQLAHVLATLPAQPCQKAAAELAFTHSLSG